MHAKRLLVHAKFLREKVTDELFDFNVICMVGDNSPLVALKKGGDVELWRARLDGYQRASQSILGGKKKILTMLVL